MEYIIGIEFLKNIPQTDTVPRRRHPAAWIRFTRVGSMVFGAQNNRIIR